MTSEQRKLLEVEAVYIDRLKAEVEVLSNAMELAERFGIRPLMVRSVKAQEQLALADKLAEHPAHHRHIGAGPHCTCGESEVGVLRNAYLASRKEQ